MLLTAIKVKLAAMVVVAGLDTSQMKGISPELEKTLETLSADQQDKAKDVNQSFNTALTKIKELADKDDGYANYIIGRWSLQGAIQGAGLEQVMAYLKKASDKNVPLAKAELGGLMLQAFPQDPAKIKEGIGYIQEAEAAGNTDALRALAQFYLQGVPAAGIDQSVEKAKALFEKGSTAGDGASTLALFQLYAGGVKDGNETQLIPQDTKQALALLTKAAEVQENPQAMGILAGLYFGGGDPKGINIEKNPQKAIDMFKKAADKGNPTANRSLAILHENGSESVVTRDLEKAAEYYTKAANAGDPQSQFRLAVAHELGMGEVDKDGKVTKVIIAPNQQKTALDLYRIAAQSGMAEANYNVGMYYENGAVVDKDAEKAFAFFMRAAQGGLAQAQHKVATYYQNGVGIGRDIVAALGWFQRAADQNFGLSQLVMGAMNEMGVGMPQNFTAAALNYSMAADQGIPLAMIRLASLHERGKASSKGKDLARAWAYAQQAVDASKDAKGNENPTAVKFRDDIFAKMSDAEKAEGKKLLDGLKSKANAGAAPAAPATETAPATKSGSGAKKTTK
jgi:uncharacterized protein